MRQLFKFKLIAFRQCPKRLWLEIHRPVDLRDDSGTEAVFRIGREVGEVAQEVYDSEGAGTLLPRCAGLRETVGGVSGSNPEHASNKEELRHEVNRVLSVSASVQKPL